jgi:hypothetical protein
MKNFKKILSSQQGISLIELTVAAAISVIISMGVVKTNQTGQKGMTKLTTDMDLKMWQQQRLMQTLGEPGACANTFPAHSISSSASVPAIRDTQNNIVYSAGDDIEGGAWTINSMSIDAVPAADITPTVNKYTTNLRLVMQRKNKESFGGSTKSIIVPIVMVRASDPSTQLVSCSAGSVGADGLWNQELANGGYIHSASNNVIIGSNGSTPKAPFQIDINSGSEWPGDTENNVFPAMRINTSGDAIVFGPGGGSGALYQSRPWDGYVPGNCLVMGHGDSGNILSKIESCNQGVRVNSYRSRIDGANATIIGGSNAYANGQFSIATGEKAKAYGTNSFAQGEHTTVTGRNSATFGYGGLVSGANSFGAGYNAHAYGENSIALGSNVLARGRNSVAIGLSSWASADYSTAIGPNAKVAASHYNSMVLSDGYQTNSTAPGQFTAHFRNGFKFITGFSSYPSGSAATNGATEARSVFIDTNGNMGIGSDLSQSPSSSFTENRKPKLFVNGDTEIYGDLYVNGQKIGGSGGSDTSWKVLSLASGWTACSWPGAAVPQYRKEGGLVLLKGCIRKTGIPAYGSTAFTMPVGYRAANHGSMLGPIPRTVHGSMGSKAGKHCYIGFVFTSGQMNITPENPNQFTSADGDCCHLTGVSFFADN